MNEFGPAVATPADLAAKPRGSRDERKLGASGWLWCGAMICAGGLMVGFRWVNFTLSKDLYGFAFSFFGYSPNHPTIIVDSFGVAAGIILACTILARILGKPGIQACLGALLILVTLTAYMRVAAGDPNLLLILARQSDWWLIIAGHPSPLSRIEPGIWDQLSFDTVVDRMISGWYYLGMGWYAGFAAGVLSLGAAISRLKPAHTGVIVAITVLGSSGISAAFLANPILAQRAFAHGANFEAAGDLNEARTEYLHATKLDGWYALNPTLYERIGAMDASLGRTGSPEYSLYEAEQVFNHNQIAGSTWEMESALRECDRVAALKGPIARAAAMRAAEMRTFYGQHLFEDGSFAAAAYIWNTALSTEPGNWLTAYELTLAYPAIGAWSDLAKISQRFIDKCSDPLTAAVFYNSLGLAQIELGHPDAGHSAYYASYKRDYLNNSGAITGLVGP
jgi:hypothetical protein